MRRLANGTQVAALPSLAAAIGAPGYASPGDPAGGIQASVWDTDQYNRMQEEIARFVEGFGLALDGSQLNQMFLALTGAFPGLLATGRSIGSPGYFRLPGGLLLQWVRNLTGTTNSSGSASVVFTYPVAFPTGVLSYSYCLVNEDAAYNDWTMVVGRPYLTNQGMSMKIPGGGAGQLVGVSGIVLGY